MNFMKDFVGVIILQLVSKYFRHTLVTLHALIILMIYS